MNYDKLIEDFESFDGRRNKRSLERKGAPNHISFQKPVEHSQISTFGKKNAHKKLDKLNAVAGELDQIIPEDFNEEDPIDLEIDLIDVSPFQSKSVLRNRIKISHQTDSSINSH